MVYVKGVELSRFKSFGGTTSIPFLPGFTVISGPNGSGKSNILDAILFCLGLASSKGMRAERLPDLINHNHSNNGSTAEASVSVTFDLSDLTELDLSLNSNSSSASEDDPDSHTQLEGQTSSEFKVTRRLRVAKGGNYASTFYVNDQPCTSSELHSQLNRLRIYPEGYNVVLQGDVTRIITMNPRERREIIDELAGVAEFDRKIDQTKQTLEAVREREERCEIIRQELSKNGDRLQNDRQKAEKYQKLKAKIHEKQQWEIVLHWRCKEQEQQNLQKAIVSMEAETLQLQLQLTTLAEEIEQAEQEFSQLNHQVKELGEEEQISLASKLATQKAKRQQLQQRQQELSNLKHQLALACTQTETEIEEDEQNLAILNQEKQELERQTIPDLVTQRDGAKATLAATKQKAQAIASQSQAWVEKQTNLTHEIAKLQQTLNPKLTQKALLSERYGQLQQSIATQNQQLATIDPEIASKQQQTATLRQEVENAAQQLQNIARKLANLEADISLSQETANRLLKEQREKQRQLDKLEATKQAQQEAQGTYATKIILHSDLPGLCGLVAQLGQVEPRYQLALEVAAGGRLGYIVVEDDSVASAGIQLLKQQRAGRATFLPLNKIQPPPLTETVVLRYAQGFVDLAVNLINCESRYEKIFAYVFGNTVVFENLDSARAYLGKHRLVTLDGEILELSGAMTGGSAPSRSSLHFGTLNYGDSEELELLGDRLKEIEDIMSQLNRNLTQKEQTVKQLTENLNQWRQKRQKEQLRLEQVQQELGRLEQQKEQLTAAEASNHQQIVAVKKEVEILEQEIPILEVNLAEKQHQLAELKASHHNQAWQEIQIVIATQESDLDLQQEALRKEERKLQELVNQCSRLEGKISQARQNLFNYQQQQKALADRQENLTIELAQINQNITTNEKLFQQLAAKLAQVKQQRDEAEKKFRNLQNQEQKTSWQLQKLADKQQEKQDLLLNLQAGIEQIAAELPDPLPEIPLLVNHPDADIETGAITFDNLKDQLEQLQKEIRNGQKRLEAMEPVNMLALEEYERNQERLKELSEKLATLKAERTELLLRIENFTTLRFRAFKEAFDAVNDNFQSIFATLSEGDGYLQLDDPENPFDGGLNLIAHPKGKPVQRLSSMSGGEKSLTALSFIFALQRYRPSPFYGFDEVDMFLDGANVEKLAKMIRKQSEQAQFIVVSLRRPMIESAQRTIGVTQARGAYTQVLGIKL
jgi:chromosome segregation protein